MKAHTHIVNPTTSFDRFNVQTGNTRYSAPGAQRLPSVTHHSSFITHRSSLLLKLLFFVILHSPFSILHSSSSSSSQIHPVHVTTQLIPPYSVYLADYAAPGCEQLRVILLQRDMSQSSYQLQLRMSITWNGREIIRTSPHYHPTPLTVQPGISTVISGSDLYHYLDPQNMEFTGYSRESYLRTKSLPEGQYQITFTAYDHLRPDKALSLPGTAFLYLAKAEPPLLNLPPNQYIQPAQPVQNVLFSWLPRNIASPNSVNSTEYLLELFEIRPAGYNPNEIVKNTRPVFSTQTERPQYLYNIADPALIPGLRYAWRVRAIDTQGRDAIRNNGYSEVFTFTYGDTETDTDGKTDGGTPTVNAPTTVDGFKVEAVAPRRAKASWTANPEADGYKLMYRQTNTTESSGWKEEQTAKDQLELNGLIPEMTYEARLQSKRGTRWGGYSELVTFTQPKLQVVNCGDAYTPATAAQLHREPLRELKPYAEIDAGGFPVTVLEATGGEGRFSGRGYAQVPMLGYIKLRVEFKNIFVNSDYYLVEGEIHALSNPDKNAIWDLDAITEGGAHTGKVDNGNEQIDIIVDFEIPGEDSFGKDENGNITITDGNGNTHVVIENGEWKMENEENVTPKDSSLITHHSSLETGSSPEKVVKDSSGNLYSVNTNTGQATHLGKAASGKPLSGAQDFNSRELAADRGVVTFSANQNTRYAFDLFDPKYANSSLLTEKYEEIKTTGEAYKVPFKLIPVGQTDVVQVTLTPATIQEGWEMKAIDPAIIIFRAKNGTEYKAGEWKMENGKLIMNISLPAANANDGYELYALHPVYAINNAGYKYDMLGKLTVLSYPVKSPKLVLVPVNGNDIDATAVKAYLDKVYLPVGVNWQVSRDAGFNCDIPKDSLDVRGSGLFSRYTSGMKKINAAYMAHKGASFDPSVLYIFALQWADDPNVSGDMPRGKQFGYVFTGAIAQAKGMPQNEIIGRTIAHEVAHGMFRLKHTFDNEYRVAEASTDNLMDYNWGTHLIKHQWDAIHDPGMVIGLFEREEDGMQKVEDVPHSGLDWVQFTPAIKTGDPITFLAPSGLPFSVTEKISQCWVADKLDVHIPNSINKLIATHPGAVYGFKTGNQTWEAIFSDKQFLGYYNRESKAYYTDSYTLTIDKNTFFNTYYWRGRWVPRYSSTRITEKWVNLKDNNPNGYRAAGIFDADPVSRLKSSTTAPDNAKRLQALRWKDFEYEATYIQSATSGGVYFKYHIGQDSLYIFAEEIKGTKPRYYLYDPNMKDWQEYNMPKFEDNKWINGWAVMQNEGHTMLDLLGTIPVIGEVADAGNAVWYLTEGEWGHAGLCAICVVPILGDGLVKSGKYAIKSLKGLKIAKPIELTAEALADFTRIGKLFPDNPEIVHLVGRILDLAPDAGKNLEKLIAALPDAATTKAVLSKIEKLGADDCAKFLTDAMDATGTLAKNLDKINERVVDAWKTLYLAGRTGLCKDFDAIIAFNKLAANKKLSQLGISDNMLAQVLRNGWGGKPEIPSFAKFCDEVNELVTIMPQNTRNFDQFMGAAGFTNASKYAQRHSYTQLQRLLENKAVLKSANEVIFESEINLIGKSITDIRLQMPVRGVIEIETKAGMQFFETLGDASNFVTQSGNSLMAVSKLEDYKVFLNPGLIVDKQAAIKKVVDAWSKQDWFKNPDIMQKFSSYLNKPIRTSSDLETTLRINDSWFDEIFLKNLKE